MAGLLGDEDMQRRGRGTVKTEVERYFSDVSVLIAEDDPDVRNFMTFTLRNFIETVDVAPDGAAALELYRKKSYDLVISDIEMPEMNGIELVRAIKGINKNQSIIITSGYNDSEYLIDLINLGVDRFLPKPVSRPRFIDAVTTICRLNFLQLLEKKYQKLLEDEVTEKTHELTRTIGLVEHLSDEVVLRLSSAAEYRDHDTGSHLKRMAMFASRLTEGLGMPDDFVRSIAFAAPLHDVGKIGIPDSILLKPGKLTPEEFEIMKNHTTIGGKMLSGSDFDRIRVAELVALTHHERWDGTGYPSGLSGDNIPLEGRIMTICDQYDALRSKRPYKEPFTHADVCEILLKGNGRTMPEHFDPRVLSLFDEMKDEFDTIYSENQ